MANAKRGPYLDFGTWFEAQFGRTPWDIEKRVRAYERAKDLVDHARGQMRVVEGEDHLAELYDAAMKGWIAGYEAGNIAAHATALQKTPEELLEYSRRSSRRGHRRPK